MKQPALAPYAACSAARIAWPGGSVVTGGIEYTTVAPLVLLSAVMNVLGVVASTNLSSAPSAVSSWSRPVDREHTRTLRPDASAAFAMRVPTYPHPRMTSELTDRV